MPFASKAQMRYMNANPKILGEKGLKEWNDATTEPHKLPERISDDNSVDSQLAEEKDPSTHPTTKKGPNKYSPSSSLHRLVNQLAKGGR